KSGQSHFPLERIVQAGENGGALVAIANINITYHGWAGDGAEADPAHLVEIGAGEIAGVPPYVPEVDKRRDLQVHVGAFRVEPPEDMPHFGACGKSVA